MAFELFKPPDKGISLLTEYPELADIDEFRDLQEEELLFSYYMGCPASPYFHNEKKDDIKGKRTVCFTKAFGKNDTQLKTKYINGRYPEAVRVAIDRFEKFRPTARMRAKNMIDQMFTNLEAMVSLKDDEVKLLEPDEMAKYVNLSQKAMDMMPKLLRMKELGFGVSQSGSPTEDDNGETLLDKALT